MIRRPPRSTLFPYPPLSRSPGPPGLAPVVLGHHVGRDAVQPGPGRVPVPLEGRPPLEGDPEHLSQQVLGLSRRSEEHTSELQSQSNLVCRLLLEKKKKRVDNITNAHSPQSSPQSLRIQLFDYSRNAILAPEMTPLDHTVLYSDDLVRSRYSKACVHNKTATALNDK